MELSRWIRPGDGVVFGQACAEPQTLVEALVAQRQAYRGATLFLGVNWSGTVKPEHADHLRLTAYCGSGHNRTLADAGVLDIHPHPYSQLASLIRQRKIKADVVLLQVSPPNAKGEYSLGLSAEYLVPALEVCRAVIAEVNDRVPWTYSDRLLKRSDFAAFIETSREPVALPYGAPGVLEQAIARHALEFIPNGATIETGLGALPDALLALLGERKNLRIHSGSVGDGVVDLMNSGVVAQADGGVLMGTRKLFDHARENPRLRLRSVEFTHHPRVLGGIERFVAINSAIEVDFTGQVNAEVAKGSYLGAVGGALDFIRAANHSPGGVSLMLLPAARIVEKLQGPVATPRSEAGVIVTERGAADLRGLTLREREARLRALASGSS
ncbi:MAG TPA: acetyl-CoA hydrolase/transferase C-terminal domain-containing protein [Burkholderiales bacterium]|nr:acetyl-CoA hydrolase/transferase C-terminal domain-containing protein [Burkholderiales bacterium]